MPVTAVAPQFRRPPGPARSGRIRWLAGRSLLLHLTLVVTAPVCLLAGWWQLQRALGGNTLSFVYVFEWPAFAGVAVWAWWVLLTAPTRIPAGPQPETASGPQTPAGVRQGLLAARTRPLRWETDRELPALRAYNAYLAEINARPPVGRLPRRPKRGRSD